MKINAIGKFPQDIQDEVKERLAQLNTIDEVAEWLESIGYKISRSAIGRYSINRRSEIIALRKGKSQDGSYLHLRAECLRAAVDLNVSSKIEKNVTAKKVLKDAEEFLAWLYK